MLISYIVPTSHSGQSLKSCMQAANTRQGLEHISSHYWMNTGTLCIR